MAGTAQHVRAFRVRQRGSVDAKLLQDFAGWLHFRKRVRSPRSQRQYVYYVGRMARNLRAAGTSLLRARESDILTALPAGQSTSHYNAALRALRHFYRFAAKQGYVPSDPTLDIEFVPSTRRLPRPWSDAERVRIFAAAGRLGWRHRVLVALGYYAGLRIHEAAKVSWADLTTQLRVLGKGDREGVIPVAGPLRTLLVEWQRVCPSGIWVLPPFEREERGGYQGGVRNPRGWTPERDRHTSLPRAHAWWREVLTEAGLPHIPWGTGFHRLRHAAATNHYRASRDLLKTRDFLRHSDTRMTERYVALVDETAQVLVDSL